MKFYKVSWEELNRDCLELYRKIKDIKFDRILCISRGGLVWSRMFSDLLTIPVSHLTTISYTGIHERKDVKITEYPNQENLKNKTLLVVDEIADHGKTFQKINEFLSEIGIKKHYTLAPIIRKFTNPKPDFYLKIKNEWIIYPYELRETYEAFLKIYKTPEKAKQMLQKQHFNESEINYL